MATPLLAIESSNTGLSQAGVTAQAEIIQADLSPQTPLGRKVDVAAPGHVIEVKWTGVEGATQAEIDSASIQVGPAVVQENLGELSRRTDGLHRVVTIPQSKRIAKLKLEGLARKNKNNSWTTLTSSTQLKAAVSSFRLRTRAPVGFPSTPRRTFRRAGSCPACSAGPALPTAC